MLIRQGRQDDVPLLAGIELAAGALFPAARIPDPDGTYPMDGLLEALANGLLLVVESEATVAGFAVCSEAPGRLHLEEISVHPDHGRKGLGRALVSQVLEEAQQRGLPAVTLTTFADIPWNGPFYASMGFSPIPEADLDDALSAALAHERELGMTERIAMICRLPAQSGDDS